MYSVQELTVTGFALQVLSEFLRKGDMSEKQAIDLTKKALFENANRVYNLDLEPALGRQGEFNEPVRAMEL